MELGELGLGKMGRHRETDIEPVNDSGLCNFQNF